MNPILKLKRNMHIDCPKCTELNNKKSEQGEDIEGITWGGFTINEINKIYKFECSICNLKLEYVLDATLKFTIKNSKEDSK